MILILGLFCCFLVVVGLLVWFFTRPKEGDSCTIEEYDPNGTYKINSEGECVLFSCDERFTKIGDICEPVSPGPSEEVQTNEGIYQEDGIPSGRYIHIIQTISNDETDTENPNKTIKLAEVEVYGEVASIDLARGKPVTGSSESEEHGFVNLVDGSQATFASTLGEDSLEMDNMKIDLEYEEPIHQVVLFGTTGQLIGVKVHILNDMGTIVRTTEPITSTTDVQTYDFTHQVPRWL